MIMTKTNGKHHVTTGLPLLNYDEDLCILFVQIWEAICFAEDLPEVWKEINANPNIDQILQNFDFKRTMDEIIIYQKRIGTDEHYGQEGDYLMKIQFDK
ncbi:MAG: hypothetical protein J6B83_03205 [Bacteroidaceae bacterium]|nr:hypothetical protein [Bacteroidaceae bacterium]